MELFFIHVGTRLPYKYTTYVQLFLVTWIVWELAPSWKRQLGLMIAYVFGSYLAALATILQYRREAGALRRFAAFDTDPNTLAMTLALAIPMAWYLSATSRNATLRWACRVYILVGLVAVALTASRGGMLATMVALLIVPLTMTRLSPGRLAMAITVLAVSGAAAVAYVPTQIVERLATTGTEVEDMSLGGRFGIWKSGVRALTARPLTGYGTGMWRSAVSPWLGPNPQVAHNSFLSMAVETGLVGLSFYLAMFFAVFRATQTSAVAGATICTRPAGHAGRGDDAAELGRPEGRLVHPGRPAGLRLLHGNPGGERRSPPCHGRDRLPSCVPWRHAAAATPMGATPT